MTDLLAEFSPQSKSGPSPGEEQGRGGAAGMVGRKVRGHTAGLLMMSNTATLNLLLCRNLTGERR